MEKTLLTLLLIVNSLSAGATPKSNLVDHNFERPNFHFDKYSRNDYCSSEVKYTDTKAYYSSVLTELNKEKFSDERFYSEQYFSKVSKLVIKAQKVNAKPQKKVIKISHIPVKNGFLSSSFGFRKDPMHGSRRLHKGIDIAARYGSPVNPLGEGIVTFSGYKPGYRNTVEIKHGASVMTRYAHLKKFLVDEGQDVKAGYKIGLVGSTGRSTGPHLHLEVLLNGNQVDPQIFLANHFGSRKKSYRIATKPKKQIINKRNDNTTFSNAKRFTKVSYEDYVKSVDGLFGLSAPVSYRQ